MERIVKKAKSVRVKLFLILCLVVLSIIAFLILVNSFVLEKYYQYTKSNNLKSTYALINSYYTKGRREGIQALILACKDFGCSFENTLARIKDSFSLSDDEALEDMKLYW